MGPESPRASALTHESRGSASFMRQPEKGGQRKEAGQEPARDISLAPSQPSFLGCTQELAEMSQTSQKIPLKVILRDHIFY